MLQFHKIFVNFYDFHTISFLGHCDDTPDSSSTKSEVQALRDQIIPNIGELKEMISQSKQNDKRLIEEVVQKSKETILNR